MKLPRDFWRRIGDRPDFLDTIGSVLAVICLFGSIYGLALILYGLGWQ